MRIVNHSIRHCFNQCHVGVKIYHVINIYRAKIPNYKLQTDLYDGSRLFCSMVVL